MKDKEEKEKLLNAKAAVEENQDGVNSAEDIIELQDLKISLISSLSNRHKAKCYKEPGANKTFKHSNVIKMYGP